MPPPAPLPQLSSWMLTTMMPKIAIKVPCAQSIFVCHARMQNNFSTVPKRVWADVVRKLGVRANSGNTAADLCVHAHSRSFLHLFTPFRRRLCASYIRLGCLDCD